MSHFLLVYDQHDGKLLREQQFESSTAALAARFAAETEFAGHPSIEIVVLSAESEEQLHETHGRYFFTLSELVDRMTVA